MIIFTSHWRKIYDFRDSCCPGYTLLAGRCIPETEDPCSPGMIYFFTWNSQHIDLEQTSDVLFTPLRQEDVFL